MTKGYSMVILKMSQEGQGKIVVRVVHACCWEIKVTRVLQNLSNLKVGHFFFQCLFRSGVKSAFIRGAPGELLEDLTP